MYESGGSGGIARQMLESLITMAEHDLLVGPTAAHFLWLSSHAGRVGEGSLLFVKFRNRFLV